MTFTFVIKVFVVLLSTEQQRIKIKIMYTEDLQCGVTIHKSEYSTTEKTAEMIKRKVYSMPNPTLDTAPKRKQ